MSQPKAHDWILDLAPYVPGRSTADGVAKPVKLSANESTFGPSAKALTAAHRSVDEMLWYPDGGSTELRDTIADVHGLDPSKVVCGTGSGDILTLLIQAYAGPGDEVIHSQYGFMIYPIYAQVVGATAIAVPNQNWAADVDAILEAVTSDTKLVFIDNPNNPTGAYLDWSEIERLHAGLRDDIILVLDAAYAECVTANDYHAGEKLVERANNVVMTRTFSKMYALAGLRIGWAYGAPELIDIVNRIRMPFNVSMPAHDAAVEAVKDQEHLKAAIDFNHEWREWVTASLMALGLDVVPSQTNFVLVGFPDEAPFTAEEAYNYLTGRGYLLRWLPSQGLKNHLRLTIGKAEQNRAVVQLLSAFMNGSREGGDG